jgi:putative inorganic carbon (HCO3(-)) transporter
MRVLPFCRVLSTAKCVNVFRDKASTPMPIKRQRLDDESSALMPRARRAARLSDELPEAAVNRRRRESKFALEEENIIFARGEKIADDSSDEFNSTAADEDAFTQEPPRWLKRRAPRENEAEHLLARVSSRETKTGSASNSTNSKENSSASIRLGADSSSAAQILRSDSDDVSSEDVENASSTEKHIWSGRRGHALTFVGVFLFTFVLYFRPYELFTALKGFDSMALIFALITIAVFIPSQLGLEGTLTARPPEVNWLLLLVGCGLCSIVVAQDHEAAWAEFSQRFIKAVVIFIILVNALRTKMRLHALVYLALAVSLYLSARAFLDYKAGRVSIDNRVFGALGGIFENPNDLALHLVTIIPLVVALFLLSRNLITKTFCLLSVGALTLGVIVTFSRGGFLGLIGMGAVLAWKFGRRNRFIICVVFGACVLAIFALAPGNYIGRLATIFHPSGEESASLRKNLLTLSIKVALRHPLFGVGMGNFPIWSVGSQVTHNAYTQIASEMGFFALVCYALFLITPFRGLARIERETTARKREAKFYYCWSICLQASLAGYMISSFFASVAYQWYIYYLVAYAICVRRLYDCGLHSSFKSQVPSLKSSEESGVMGQEAGEENRKSVIENRQSSSQSAIQTPQSDDLGLETWDLGLSAHPPSAIEAVRHPQS